MSDALQPHGLYSLWNSPGQNTGVDSLSLLQGVFPTQGLNVSLPHCRQILYQLRYKYIFILEILSYCLHTHTTHNTHTNTLSIMAVLLFGRSVMSSSFWPYALQHARLPCPSPSHGACSNSCPLSGWCHPTILSSVIPFSSCLLSFPASGSFPISQLFTQAYKILFFWAFEWLLKLAFGYVYKARFISFRDKNI